MSGEPLIVFDKVSKTYGRGELSVTAVRRVSLTVQAHELVAVMGPSGSGKSTMINLAGALDLPSAGGVAIEGVDPSRLDGRRLARLRRRSIGMVFQDFNLIAALTAAENVALPLELDGAARRGARRAADEALEQVGLSAMADRFPDELSGGQRQRIAIARALIGRRRIILADEPSGALDSTTADAVHLLLRQRCDAGTAGILVTHEPRFAAWADRVIFLRDGAVVDPAAEHRGVDRLLTDAP